MELMSVDEFVKKWTGKPCDFDGAFGNQCMDIMHQYIYDVLGLTDAKILQAPNARLAYTNFKWEQYFTKINNTPEGVPLAGDIMFWGDKVGTDGHVAIFLSGNVNQFYSFDQNWAVGTLPHIQLHTYYGVLGWLRPKPIVVDPTVDLKKQIAELKNKIEKAKEVLK